MKFLDINRLPSILTVASSFFIATLSVAPAHAADPSAFELDTPSANILSNGQVDWSRLYDVAGPTAVPTPKTGASTPALPAGYTSPSFSRDFVPGRSSDSTTFATGSKDTLNISTGWQCGASNNLGDKVDLLNAYAVSYNDPVSSDTIVYFGVETASNEGTRDVGFWFLKDGTVACTAGGGKNSNFTGNHQDGDVLVVAEYTGGGGVSVVNVFRWNGGANGSLASLTSGVDCSVASLESGADVCGTTNRSALIGAQVPWLTQTKTSNPSVPNLKSTDLDRGEFFEGGINLTNLGLNACFGKFLADTRSSATANATIFDFTVGPFASCKIGVSKSCDVTRVATDAERMLSGKNFLVSFSGKVTNTGGGIIPVNTVVTVVDDAGTPAPTTGDDVTKVITLQSDLEPTKFVTFSGTFFSNQNPPLNTVTASALVSNTTITADPFSIECTALPLSANLSVTKNCGIPAALNGGVAKPGTELVPVNGALVAKVNVSGEICNTSPVSSAIPYLTVNATEQVGTSPQGGLAGVAVQGFPADLIPGACKSFALSYFPTAGDGSTSPASNGMFTDTINAVGSHPALPVAKNPTATGNAHCPICPCTGTSCPAP